MVPNSKQQRRTILVALWGGIEAGGTKFVCAVGVGPGEIAAEATFRTETPKETIEQVINFFLQQKQRFGPYKAIGIGSFGPIDLDRASPTFGYITSTPKKGWAQTDLVGAISKNLESPVNVDTDVNVAALAENYWGSAKGLDTFIYLTVGTGIGGGGMINGKLMSGLLHPEMGHMIIPHDVRKDPFPGSCPFHGDCLEGLAAGSAVEKRWEKKGEQLSNDHRAWRLEAQYLALGIVNIILTISPQRVILGGGIMQQEHLFILIREKVLSILNGYIKSTVIVDNIDDYIVPPTLGCWQKGWGIRCNRSR